MTNHLPVPVALLRCLLAGWLAGAGLGGAAQQPASQFYSAFEEDLPAGVTTLGTAFRSATGSADAAGGVLKLTVTSTNQTGSLVISDIAGGAAVTNLWARFQVRAGGGTGGEGFSFNLATNLVASDRPAEAFGESGVTNGLRIQFATRAVDGGQAPGLRILWGDEVLGQQDAALRTGQDFVPVEIHFSRAEDSAGGQVTPLNRIHIRYGTNTVEAVRTNWATLPEGTALGLGARTSELVDHHWIDNLLVLANYNDGPPVLVRAPTNATARFEYRARLSVVADGTPPLAYEWLVNGVEIPGETEPEYLTPPMDFSRNGARYSVRVSNAHGTVTSDPATVDLDPVSTMTWAMYPKFNLITVPFLAGDGSLNALWSSAPHGATFWKFDNARQNWSTTPEVFVEGRGWLPGTTRLLRGEGGALYSPIATTLTATGIVAQTTLPGGITTGINLRGRPEPGRARYQQIYSGLPAAGLQAFLWDGQGQMFRQPAWQYVSNRWSPNVWQAGPGQGVFFVGAGGGPPQMPPNQRPALTPIGHQRIYENETNVVGFTVSDPDHLPEVLTTTVTNDHPELLPPDGMVFGGNATNRTLTLTPADRRWGVVHVTVTVTDPLGGMSSREFRLRVVATDGPPVFFLQPTNTVVEPGETVTLVTEAEGRRPISYLWRRNGALLRHETDRLLVITNAQPEDGGMYSAVAMNALGVDESTNAVVQVTVSTEEVLQDGVAGAKLAWGDAGRTSLSNRNATREPGEPLHAGKRGTHSVWFRWEPATNGIATIDTLGSTFDTLLAVYTGTGIADLAQVADDDDGAGYFNSRVSFNAQAGTSYLVAVDGFEGEAGDITLKWDLQPGAGRLPLIRRHPEGLALPPRARAEFSVTVDDPAPQELRYQWFHNGTNALALETKSSLVLSQLNAGHLGTYRVEVIRDAVTNTSHAAVLELATAGSTPTFDKLGDAVIPAGPPPNMPSPQRAPRRPASIAVSVGTPGSHLFLNNSGDTQVQENFDRGVVFGRSRWIPVEMPDEGTLVVDTFGSGVDTVASLLRWDGIPDADPILLADNNDARTGVTWSLLVATNLPAGSGYYVLVDRVITPTNVNAADGPIHVNWTFVPQDAEFRSTLPTLFTEADLRNVESLVTNLMDGQLPLHDYLRGQFGAKTNTLSDWLARDPALRTAAEVTGVLVAGLNDLVTGGLLWTSDRFAGVELDDELLARIKRDTKPGKWPRLNHLLLEEVFAGALQQSSERLFQRWVSLHASGRTHFRVVDDPGRSRLEFQSAGDLFDATGGLGWRKLVGSLDLDDSGWLNIIQLPDSGAPGTNRFYRVVRQAR